MKVPNLVSRHLGFFPKGLAYDLGSKFQVFLKFVYAQIGPREDMWMFQSEIKVIVTIYEDVKFDQSPSWIFSNGVTLWIWDKISNFFKVCI